MSFSNPAVRANEQHRDARPLLRQARQSVPQAMELRHVRQRDGVLGVGIVHTLKSLAEHSDEIVHPHCGPRATPLDLNEPPLAIPANCLDIDAPLPSPRNPSTPTVRIQPPLQMGFELVLSQFATVFSRGPCAMSPPAFRLSASAETYRAETG